MSIISKDMFPGNSKLKPGLVITRHLFVSWPHYLTDSNHVLGWFLSHCNWTWTNTASSLKLPQLLRNGLVKTILVTFLAHSWANIGQFCQAHRARHCRIFAHWMGWKVTSIIIILVFCVHTVVRMFLPEWQWQLSLARSMPRCSMWMIRQTQTELKNAWPSGNYLNTQRTPPKGHYEGQKGQPGLSSVVTAHRIVHKQDIQTRVFMHFSTSTSSGLFTNLQVFLWPGTLCCVCNIIWPRKVHFVCRKWSKGKRKGLVSLNLWHFFFCHLNVCKLFSKSPLEMNLESAWSRWKGHGIAVYLLFTFTAGFQVLNARFRFLKSLSSPW